MKINGFSSFVVLFRQYHARFSTEKCQKSASRTCHFYVFGCIFSFLHTYSTQYIFMKIHENALCKPVKIHEIVEIHENTMCKHVKIHEDTWNTLRFVPIRNLGYIEGVFLIPVVKKESKRRSKARETKGR